MEKVVKTTTTKTKPTGRKRNTRTLRGTKTSRRTGLKRKNRPNQKLVKRQGITLGGFRSNKNFTKDQKLHLRNILDPWNAVDARWYRENGGETRTAKPKTTFKINTNAGGNLLIYFDPDYASTNGANTNFAFCNDVTLTGSTQVVLPLYSTGPVASVAVPPATTVLRLRLVSAAIKATVKLSALNNVGTIFACDDYGDMAALPVNILGTVNPTSIGPTMSTYSVFQQVLQGNSGRKVDIIGQVAEIYWTWYPMDPTAEIYTEIEKDVGEFPATGSAGGSPKCVIAFEALNNGNTTSIEFEIVWNYEYLAYPQAAPWIGRGNRGLGKTEHTEIVDFLSSRDHGAMTAEEMQSIQRHFYQEEMDSLGDPSNMSGLYKLE